MTVFADTSSLYAAIVRTEDHHPGLQEAFSLDRHFAEAGFRFLSRRGH